MGSTLIFSFSSGPKLPSTSMVITASPPRLCLDRRKLQIFTPASAMTSVTARNGAGRVAVEHNQGCVLSGDGYLHAVDFLDKYIAAADAASQKRDCSCL